MKNTNFSRDAEEIIQQAKRFVQHFAYPSMSIKIQVGWNELETIKQLSRLGISVNCTACMTATQAIMAANAGQIMDRNALMRIGLSRSTVGN